MTDSSPVLELCGLSRSFARGAVPAVDGVNLTVGPAEIVSILGPSGCGKTTTMRMIAGLDAPTTGDIRIFGKSVLGVPAHRRNVGLVFQSLAIFPHMTVRENVAFGLRMQKLDKSIIASKVNSLLDVVQMPHHEFGDRYPDQLSGGQRQRVALARTLVTEPTLVLFDEPMASLDRRLRDYMAVELRAIQKKLGIAAIYVTHDQETACAMSDRIAIMKAGRIVQVGQAEAVYGAPASSFVAEFLGDANFIVPDAIDRQTDGRFTARFGDAAVDVAGDPDATGGGQIVVMFRPEHAELRLATDAAIGGIAATLTGKQFGGGRYRWHVEMPNRTALMIQATEDRLGDASTGDQVMLSINPGCARFVRR